ncbi:G-type lectin S-receptor-like serine/threonine-protein kinase At1g11300 [Juglans regia]|uniref:non-specific serine/threonine protein kinase n=2 Tax=Juglans regia TaxID=51240 RepID=A0A6P9E416_JUGRE|nr:G-type lectin S-receptor-like serine/threonine-protein kinase At1g11300 [Juglans regia]
MLFDLSTETHAIIDATNTKDNDKKRGKKDVELPLFSYESVSSATDNFSTANKLGEGGFGPVYKGKLLKGQKIAVKMLSKRTGQGLEEFRNETTLIAKLQHRNLVKLLGCCIEGNEKILIYEYMPNKSLDFYLFDPTKKQMLDWGTRVHIIEGIAQGLLYLHQYSRLRIIHRDLKPSNILLDSEMNPKISDFGMARIVGDNEIQANTNRIVGTIGYMSPEYVTMGLYSIKSDVFSFGVLLLEIVSGKKNTSFYNFESLNLVRYAWELWRDGRSVELMDSTIGCSSSTSTPVRYINIGLLCVQESPADRPDMRDVVSMISNEHSPLPTPKQPAFTAIKSAEENCSINSATFSIMEARHHYSSFFYFAAITHSLRGMVTNIAKSWHFFVLLLTLSYCKACFSLVGDTISAGRVLTVNDRLESQGGIFELGFNRLPSSSSRIYLCIWYKNFDAKDIVWVANRENPLSDPSSLKLKLSEDGNLVLLGDSSKIPFWSTKLSSPLSKSTEAVLRDDGNLVLRDNSSLNTIFWESFDHPTDTWLPGAKLGIDKVTGKSKQIISWKSLEDPAPGMFSFGLDPNGSMSQFILRWNRTQIYWRTGDWTGKSFSLAPDMWMNDVSNYNFVSSEKEQYFIFSVKNTSRFRFYITPSGQIQQMARNPSPWAWAIFWSQPANPCGVYASCGAFGVCTKYGNCECLKGFEPSSIEDANLKDWSGVCVRKLPLQCENSKPANGKSDSFLEMSNMGLPVNPITYLSGSARICEKSCMEKCSCTAYAYNINTCMIWEGALLNITQLPDGDPVGKVIHLRLAGDEHQIRTKGNKWRVRVIIGVLVPAAVVILCLCICFSRGKLKRKGEQASSNDIRCFDFNTEFHAMSDEPITEDNLKRRGKKDAELPLFSYKSVLAATNNFSIANKLGEGGFGPVYKGKLFRGQEIAVKMLSKNSGQGLEEFRNETILIAKLQHRNLVRVLGCCIEQDEKILIYEYMPNKSLDFYLFDPTKKKMLNWETRIHIIEGIAQGLLYLHQHSRLRVIHRDLKPSNILLDSRMNPKISDFGMARIVGDNQTHANTRRIVGTYGYMSPEYAMEGLYSIKSDVFSFGVLLLEIVSGKKNTGFYNSESLNLLNYVWELWTTDQSLDLMDLIIGYPPSISILLRLIHIGLLCVQESPTDRPAMLDVVSMISNEHAPLPTPKKPAFIRGRTAMDRNSAVNMSAGVNNLLTISIMEPR